MWLSIVSSSYYRQTQIYCLLNNRPSKSYLAMAEHQSQWVWYVSMIELAPLCQIRILLLNIVPMTNGIHVYLMYENLRVQLSQDFTMLDIVLGWQVYVCFIIFDVVIKLCKKATRIDNNQHQLLNTTIIICTKRHLRLVSCIVVKYKHQQMIGYVSFVFFYLRNSLN